MKIYEELEQGTPEWHQARAGKVTASVVSKIGKLDKITEGEFKLGCKLSGEKYTGFVVPTFQNHAMQHGHEYEPVAANIYEAITDFDVRKVGFVEVDEYFGISPDRLVYEGENIVGACEIKCPETLEGHVAVILTRQIPDEHMDQLLTQMYALQVDWIDFVSFHPAFLGKKNEIVIIRLNRSEVQKELDKIEKRINRLKNSVKEYYEQLCA